MEVKIIFLDVDGVLVPTNTPSNDFAIPCMKRLKQIVDATNAYLVVSSDWRKEPLLYDMLVRGLEEHQIKTPNGKTPILKTNDVDWTAFPANVSTRGAIRTTEILKWLSTAPGVTKYAAIDDHPLYLGQSFFQTHPSRGIDDTLVHSVTSYLNS